MRRRLPFFRSDSDRDRGSVLELLLLEGQDAGRQFTVDGSEVAIGRGRPRRGRTGAALAERRATELYQPAAEPEPNGAMDASRTEVRRSATTPRGSLTVVRGLPGLEGAPLPESLVARMEEKIRRDQEIEREFGVSLLGRPFRVRQGIHTGSSLVDRRRGIAYSTVLDVAGHLQKHADTDGLLISEGTLKALPEGLPFERAGELEKERIPTHRLTGPLD